MQVMWTKFSPSGSNPALDTRRTDHRNHDEDRGKIRISYKGGPLQLYFCAPDETAAAPAGDASGVTAAEEGIAGDSGKETASAPHAEIITLLQVGCRVTAGMLSWCSRWYWW